MATQTVEQERLTRTVEQYLAEERWALATQRPKGGFPQQGGRGPLESVLRVQFLRSLPALGSDVSALRRPIF
jgi:hypothetical protein